MTTHPPHKTGTTITRSLVLILLLFSFVLGGCTPESLAAKTLPTPSADLTSVSGRLIDSAGKPYLNIIIRLAEVYYGTDNPKDGAYVVDLAFSPSDVTDNDGFFFFENIAVMDYVLILGSPDSAHKVWANADNTPMVWKTEAGSILSMGEISVDFDFNP